MEFLMRGSWIILPILLMVVVTGCSTFLLSGRYYEEKRLLTTGYCKCGICCGWTRDSRGNPVDSKGAPKIVGKTASGAMVRHGTIAADFRVYPIGTVMYVEGYGWGRVEDTGSALSGDHIDLYFRSHQSALRWGKKYVKVKIWYPQGFYSSGMMNR